MIDKSNRMVKNAIESCEFDDTICVFNGNMDRIGLQYDMLSGMFIFFFFLLFCDVKCRPFCF